MDENNIENYENKDNNDKKVEKTITISLENWEKFFSLKDYFKAKNSDDVIENLYEQFKIQSGNKFKKIGNRVVIT